MIERKVHPPEPYPTGFMWWFRNGDSWATPEYNNDAPYLPGRPKWWRATCWALRNPLGNFVGFIIGVAGRGYTAVGEAPVDLTLLMDDDPPRYGLKTTMLESGSLRLPFFSYCHRTLGSVYLGWRPYSGGFGFRATRLFSVVLILILFLLLLLAW